MLHIDTDADTSHIIAATPTRSDTSNVSQVSPLLDQVTGPVAFFTADGAYDWHSVYDEVAARHPEAAVVVPSRANAAPSSTAETAPTQRDCHLRSIEEQGRMGWQTVSGINWRALAEADVNRFKRVIGDGLRCRQRVGVHQAP